MKQWKHIFFVSGLLMMALPAVAQVGASAKNDAPIEISSDKLDVLQAEHKAILTGNVIAVQGTTTMRSTQMIVLYREDKNSKSATPANVASPTPSAPTQGIYRIEAEGHVVFTTPTEIVIGDKGIYNVDTDTIDVVGSAVTLTRGQNILKGTRLNYNMATGRSALTGGSASNDKPARVHGLFVPKSNDTAAGPK